MSSRNLGGDGSHWAGDYSSRFHQKGHNIFTGSVQIPGPSDFGREQRRLGRDSLGGGFRQDGARELRAGVLAFLPI